MAPSSASGAPSFRIAVVIKTYLFHTIGVENPFPGTAVLHFIFVLSLHETGGLLLGAMPLASGPRQAGQLLSMSVPVCENTEVVINDKK